MPTPGPTLKAVTLVLLTLIWGTTWAAIAVSLRGFPPFTGVALRFVIAASLLLAYARVMRLPLAPATRGERRRRVAHALVRLRGVAFVIVFEVLTVEMETL